MMCSQPEGWLFSFIGKIDNKTTILFTNSHKGDKK